MNDTPPVPMKACSAFGVAPPWALRGRSVGDPWAIRGSPVGAPWALPEYLFLAKKGSHMSHGRAAARRPPLLCSQTDDGTVVHTDDGTVVRTDGGIVVLTDDGTVVRTDDGTKAPLRKSGWPTEP